MLTAPVDGYRPLHPRMAGDRRGTASAFDRSGRDAGPDSIAHRHPLPQLLETDNGTDFAVKILDR